MRASHILGLNSRNHLYLSRYNTRRGRQIADSKYLTKKLLRRRKLPHPRLLAYFDSADSLAKFDWSQLSENFVVKPAAGYAGEGIVLVRKRLNKMAKIVTMAKMAEKNGIFNHSSHFDHSNHSSNFQ
ncbi:MAG TPA: sugar-transfer associated ATP-grasp domain-containing protein, partial [Patescibacteria group bacterium]|nr:sugar-transfer associated ATP-grasp domain-containing protein [Patescibacteria group bacterium]